jgi:hypothetical protein
VGRPVSSKRIEFPVKVANSITFCVYNVPRTNPLVDWTVPALYVMFLSSDVPNTVVLSMVIKGDHLSVAATVHEPYVPTAGAGAANTKYEEEQDEHLVASFLMEHPPHEE